MADNEGNYNLKIYLFKSKNNQKQGWMLSKILEIYQLQDFLKLIKIVFTVSQSMLLAAYYDHISKLSFT